MHQNKIIQDTSLKEGGCLIIMWNKFRLWFNRNDTKILTIAVIIIGIMILIKSTNQMFKSAMEERNAEISANENTQNTSVFDGTEYDESLLNELDKTSDDYKIANKIIDKFLNNLYIANKNNDVSAKQKAIDMCSSKFIENLTTPKRTITTDNILDYLLKIDNKSNYSVENIYKYDEKNDVAKYIMILKYEDDVTVEKSYMVFNADKTNMSFAFCGSYMELDYIMENSSADFGSIENNGANGF